MTRTIDFSFTIGAASYVLENIENILEKSALSREGKLFLHCLGFKASTTSRAIPDEHRILRRANMETVARGFKRGQIEVTLTMDEGPTVSDILGRYNRALDAALQENEAKAKARARICPHCQAQQPEIEFRTFRPVSVSPDGESEIWECHKCGFEEVL